MRTRLALAYGMVHALLGSVVIVITGLGLEQMTLGVTRQPLPLVWPLAVLHVVVAQLPLREILGPAERVAVRGPVLRGVRAAVVVLLLGTGVATYASPQGNRTLFAFFLTLAATGYAAAAVSRADPWAWTLGLGMVGVGLIFITPLGVRISRGLTDVPVPVSAAIVGLAVGAYVASGRVTAGPRLPGRRVHRAS